MIDKVVAILDACADRQAHSATDIAHLTGLPVSTVHRLASQLVFHGLLERDQGKRYRLGVLGRVDEVAPGGRHDSAVQVMRDLAAVTGLDVRLGTFVNGGVAVAVTQLGAPPTFRLRTAELPAVDAGALGQVLLAHSPPVTVARAIHSGSPGQPDALLSLLGRVRRTGVASAPDDLDPAQSWIAVPVLVTPGRALAALAVRVRDAHAELPHVRPALSVAARTVSRRLSADPLPTYRENGRESRP